MEPLDHLAENFKKFQNPLPKDGVFFGFFRRFFLKFNVHLCAQQLECVQPMWDFRAQSRADTLPLKAALTEFLVLEIPQNFMVFREDELIDSDGTA
ncbi:hypothetical protein Y032_0003g1561 [Ancylostoma ceylanicum]|uniref:Uncharacterized protein n=1 Tax=Ancylostoma ceylanicum TaxID=53326 RepID=A0A016VYD4_9BILA|nr:hypothetical protein Y032_0003g1561 [Ancylostoma ceylanicum]